MQGKILIVDDSEFYRQALKSIIENLGYSAELCSDGAEAIAYIKSNNDVHAVLLDLYMPEIDGISTLGHLRSNYGQLPVIVVSSCDDADDIRILEGLGISGFVKKPFDLAVVGQAIQTMLAAA